MLERYGTCQYYYVLHSYMDEVASVPLQRKKVTKSDIEEEWEQSRQKALELLFRWLQIPLHKIWRPPIVDNSFIM